MPYKTKYKPDMPKYRVVDLFSDALLLYMNIDLFYDDIWQQIAKLNNLPDTLPKSKASSSKKETFSEWIQGIIDSPFQYGSKYCCYYITPPKRKEDMDTVQTGTYEKIRDPLINGRLRKAMESLETKSIWEIMDIYIPSEDGKVEHAFTGGDMIELLSEYCCTHQAAKDALIPRMLEISDRKSRNLDNAENFPTDRKSMNPQNLREIDELLKKKDYERFWFFFKEYVPSDGHDVSLLPLRRPVSITEKRRICGLTTEFARYMMSIILGGDDDAPFRKQPSTWPEAYMPALIGSYMPFRWVLLSRHTDDSQLMDLRKIAAHKPMLTTRDLSEETGTQPVFPVRVHINYNYMTMKFEGHEAAKARREKAIKQNIDCWLYAGEDVPDDTPETDYVCTYGDLKLSISPYSINPYSQSTYGIRLAKGPDVIHSDTITVSGPSNEEERLENAKEQAFRVMGNWIGAQRDYWESLQDKLSRMKDTQSAC